MSKISLTNIVNLENQTTAVNAINANNAVLTSALDNTLSRDGTQPNTMGSNLDMNNNQILNLPPPASLNSPVRLADVAGNPTISVPPVGTSGAVVGLLNTNNTHSGSDTFTQPFIISTPVGEPNFRSVTATTIAASGSAAISPVGGTTVGLVVIREGSFTGQMIAALLTGGGSVISLGTLSANWQINTTTPSSGDFSLAWDSGTNTYRIYNGITTSPVLFNVGFWGLI